MYVHRLYIMDNYFFSVNYQAILMKLFHRLASHPTTKTGAISRLHWKEHCCVWSLVSPIVYVWIRVFEYLCIFEDIAKKNILCQSVS